MAKKALVFLAEGFEEVEAVTPIDYLRRAGVEVTAAAIGAEPAVRGSHGIVITADTGIGALSAAGALSPAAWDAVFVPGGLPGAENLAACAAAGAFFREMAAAGKLVAAICASPAVFLAPLGLLRGKNWTCHPSMESAAAGQTPPSPEAVVVDGNLITSRGPGTAAAFALALIERLAGREAAAAIAAAALLAAPGAAA